MLKETLVVCGGEFAKTPMRENREGKLNPFKGDHHVSAFQGRPYRLTDVSGSVIEEIIA